MVKKRISVRLLLTLMWVGSALIAAGDETNNEEPLQTVRDLKIGGETLRIKAIEEDGVIQVSPDGSSLVSNVRSRFEYDDIVLETDELDVNIMSGMARAEGNIIIKTAAEELRADSIFLDVVTKEVSGEGNIYLKTPEGEVDAERVRYNYANHTGEAYGVEGRYETLYFGTTTNDRTEPTFKRVSEKEAVVSHTSVTTCDFPVPHYYVTAREFIIYVGDRVFARNAVLYVRGIPVMYFPVYSRSLKEGSPWSFAVGYESNLGGILRVGYSYRHYTEEPSFVDEEEMVMKHRGTLNLRGDWFTQRGFGHSAIYKYFFSRGRHKGIIDYYGITDQDRQVQGENDVYRWNFDAAVRSELGDRTALMIESNLAHDPEVAFDFLKQFQGSLRARDPERDANIALESMNDLFFGRILVGGAERIGRDRLTDYTEPGSDDLDFDEDPTSEFTQDQEGLPRKRYGRVSEQTPHIAFGSSYLPLTTNAPLFWMSDVHLFNALDSGLNTLDSDDDSRVNGLDAYQQLMYRLRLGSAFNLLLKAGAGGGYMQRRDDTYGYDLGAAFPAVMDGIIFTDQNTFLTGTRSHNLQEVEGGFAYADSEARLNARLSDTVNAFVRHSYRALTKDSLAEYYESIGKVEAREDIYPFKNPAHLVDAEIGYDFLDPNVRVSVFGGKNLQGEGDIYANELLGFAGLKTTYLNESKTFLANSNIAYEEYQIRDPTDIDEFERGTLKWNLLGKYIAPSQKWWTQAKVTMNTHLDDDPVGRTLDLAPGDPEYDRRKSKRSYSESDTIFTVGMSVGGKVGPKYELEVGAEYSDELSDISEAYITIKRDLHDFLVFVRLGVNNDYYDDGGDDENYDMTWDVRFGIELVVIPGESSRSILSVETLKDKFNSNFEMN